MVTMVQTSKGPMNVEQYCNMGKSTDNGEVVRYDFYMTGGSRLSLPVAEGQRLAEWLAERAVFDSTAGGK